MEILNCIDLEIQKHIQELNSLNLKNDDNKENFFSDLKYENLRFGNALRDLSSKYPFFIQLDDIENEIINNGIDNFITQVKEDAKNRVVFPPLPDENGWLLNYNITEGKETEEEEEEEEILIQVHKDCFEIPQYITLHHHNSVNISQNYLESFLLSILLSMPIGSVKLTFINLGNAAIANKIVNNLDSLFYGGDFIQQKDLSHYLETLEKRRFQIVKEYGKFSNASINNPYEIIILLGDGNLEDSISKFIKNDPYLAGIHFINVINETTTIKGERLHTRVCHIMQNKEISKAAYTYLNKEIKNVNFTNVYSIEPNHWQDSNYEPIESNITVPIGTAEMKEISFTMDIVNHTHAFIIGQSGSGKSVLLHNIIGASMLKYAPEDLQLYLLDFKLGGVEFNRYKGSKHIKALLVDNSDQQVTLEILKELSDRMTERGKLLRSKNVNNILEYNKISNEKLPHIFVVVDECHEMFNQYESSSHFIYNKISEIIKKIAKEGRNQGIHLILATQTLSGTEISNEILHNISDHYILKCASVDSERLVERSSDITSKLSTGHIYYHHSDNQIQFQAFFSDKEKVSQLMNIINKKASNHKSNGEFYFNGSTIYDLRDENFHETSKIKHLPKAYLGRSIDLSQKPITISLPKDDGENILIFGLNDERQVTRTTINVLISMLATQKTQRQNAEFFVIDCINDEESSYTDLLLKLSEKGLFTLVNRNNRATILKQLVQNIKNKKDKEIFLFIHGQEKFRELKLDSDLEENSTNTDDLMDDFFGNNNKEVKTFKQAMELILKEGPQYGIHTILQIDNPNNFLFEDYLNPKNVLSKFKHFVMLRSNESVASSLHLNDDIHLEKLSSFSDRLRAYYYAGESDKYTLFTPYITNKTEEIEQFLNK